MMTLAAVFALQSGATPPALVSGDVVLSCVVFAGDELAHCDVVSETPPGRGFGPAALHVFPWMKAPKGTPPGRQNIPVAVRMTPEEADAAGIVPPGSPPLIEGGWRVLTYPSNEELRAYEPPKARRHAGAAVQCTAQPDGRLAACRVLQADEPIYGPAAVRAAEALWRVSLRDLKGEPTAGRPVNLEVSFGRPGPPGPRGLCPRVIPNCGFALPRRR